MIQTKMTAPIPHQDIFEDERKEEFDRIKQSKAFTNTRTKRSLLPAIRERSSIRGLISFMKSVLGKDLTKVTMPVHFNEPVSFLQRLSEDLEYADILNRACFCKNSLVRLAHVAAFASSTYATVLGRFWKPFNPLLGETFEYVNHDVGYALIAEQVSHHPPISALHAESDHWVFWQEYSLDTKFRGQFFKVIPTGFCHVKFKASGHHFCWKKPVTTVHNILVGGLSVDQEGDVVVTNLSTKEQCTLHFQPIRKVQDHFKKLTGEVRDVEGHVKYLIAGSWDKSLECQPVEALLTFSHSPPNTADVNDGIDLWSASRRPEESPKMYAFTRFTMQLNDPDYDTTCPTDCRKRPDIRLLESGKIELSSVQKHRLEEKQRHAKRDREASGEAWTPRWFELREDPRSATSGHVYKGGYWTAKLQNSFTNTPDIY